MLENIEQLEVALGARQEAARALMQECRESLLVDVPIRKNGRVVVAPPHSLRRLQRSLAHELSRGYKAPDHVHGFVSGRSAASNARVHSGQEVILSVDLRSFFESISINLVRDQLGKSLVDEDVIDFIIDFCLLDRRLPVGFATSPILSNYAFQPTDRELVDWADGKRIRMSRYADDISVSGNCVGDDTLNELESLLQSHGWEVNRSKTRFLRRGHRQYVTGYYAGLERVHVSRQFKRKLRWHIFMFEKLGETSYCEHVEGASMAKLFGMIGHLNTVDKAQASELLERVQRGIGVAADHATTELSSLIQLEEDPGNPRR